ncbi:hypothetical protein AA0119_g13422 [Alternaria tenuissima]|uniref:Cytochrome P450 n=2 Tax=Alternaria alternata complex TaxID=187734 RepID=A0A4Q4MQE8_ALTAL|nr:hypothetical protein AA0117_g13276 [Alternaria alternata]RYN82557.1 hypothetical protein AA0119_g13422 [Alternaria tenuissima]RYO00076.1 hypothetical protein AA0121_g13439 [Alternaria tenuissima]RYO47967.1 hypothetical protein AA0116_g12936 [Alternaria tenuissima]
MYGRIVTPDMENVFTTTDTAFHSSHRRLLSAPLSQSSLKQFEKIVTARTQLAVQKIGEESKKCGAADVLKWWLFMATDIIGELSFGDSFRMLELGKKNQYAEDLGKEAFLSGMRISFPMAIRIAGYFSLPFLREPAAATDRLVSYARASVQRYQKVLEADPQNAPPTLFTKVYRAGEEGMSSQEIVAEA